MPCMRSSGVSCPEGGVLVMALRAGGRGVDRDRAAISAWLSAPSSSRSQGWASPPDGRRRRARPGAGLLVGLRLAHDLRRGQVDAARRKLVGREEIVAQVGVVVAAVLE